MSNSNYRLQKHTGESPTTFVRCNLMDRIDSASAGVLNDDLPYSVWGPYPPFAFGEVMAFCPSKEHAARIVKALTLLEQTEKVIQEPSESEQEVAPRDSMKRGHYPNGKLKFETPLDHQGRIHGVEKWWSEDGQVINEYPYHKDKLHGTVKGWYSNGQRSYERSYYLGEQHGVHSRWDFVGQLINEFYYLHSKRVTREELAVHQPDPGV